MIKSILAFLFLIGWASWILLHLVLIIMGGGKTVIVSEPNLVVSSVEAVLVAVTIILGVERLVNKGYLP